MDTIRGDERSPFLRVVSSHNDRSQMCSLGQGRYLSKVLSLFSLKISVNYLKLLLGSFKEFQYLPVYLPTSVNRVQSRVCIFVIVIVREVPKGN